MTRYSEDMRTQLAKDVAGKTVRTLEYDPEGDYYTMVFADGSEMSFRFMADLVAPARP